jgi:hypothetical protein
MAGPQRVTFEEEGPRVGTDIANAPLPLCSLIVFVYHFHFRLDFFFAGSWPETPFS